MRHFFRAICLIILFLDETFNRQYENEQLFGKDIWDICRSRHFRCLSGFIGSYHVCNHSTYKRNWCKKSIRCFCSEYCIVVIKKFSQAHFAFSYCCVSIGMVGNEYMAKGFCLQGQYGLVDVYPGGCICVLIALATISFQAIKAAIANPVKSLRTE